MAIFSVKKFIATIFLTALFPTLLFAATDADSFKNSTVGLELKKPKGWHFMTADQNLENIKRTKMKDAEMQKAMVKYASTPLVVITKHKEPYTDVNPSFKINIRPLAGLDGSKPEKIIELILPQLQKSFADFKLVKAPEQKKVNGRKAGYAQFQYTLATQDGGKFPTTSEIWIIPRGEYFFMVGAGTRQDEKTGSRAEIAAIVDSVKIAD